MLGRCKLICGKRPDLPAVKEAVARDTRRFATRNRYLPWTLARIRIEPEKKLVAEMTADVERDLLFWWRDELRVYTQDVADVHRTA
jgi:hypothetical protein